MMLAFFAISIVELLLILASLGVFVMVVGFVASLVRPQHSTTRHHFRVGGLFVALIAVGVVLLFFLGTQRHGVQIVHRDYGENDVLAPEVVEVSYAEADAHEVNPMQFDPDYPNWLILFMVFAVLGAVVFAYRRNHQVLFAVFFAVAVAAVVAPSFLVVLKSGVLPRTIEFPSQVSTQTTIGVVSQDGQTVTVTAVPAAEGTIQTTADPALDALWDKLTKSKINLDADSEAPAAGPEDEKAKEAVKDTFGLDDEGKLPPQWVITPPKQVGQVYRVSVASDPWATEEECRKQLVENQLPQTVARRIEYLAPSRVNRKVSVADPLVLGIGPDYILREICRDEFTGTVDSSVGEMKKVHVLLEFDENTDNYLIDAWLRRERQIRFASVSKVAALSLTGLAAIYGLLRFDTWSKGYYSRQLLVGGTLAIIALAVFLLRVS